LGVQNYLNFWFDIGVVWILTPLMLRFNMKPNQNPKFDQLRSIFSITAFVILVLGVGFLSLNFILALFHKFSSTI